MDNNHRNGEGDIMTDEERIRQVQKHSRNNTEAITMILCACADIGCASGVMLSGKEFDTASNLILKYLEKTP